MRHWRATNGRFASHFVPVGRGSRVVENRSEGDRFRGACCWDGDREEMETDMDMKLELVVLPVSDVDRAKAFYERVGFHVDHDHRVSEDLRFVQLTPPGSACSIAIGEGLVEGEPGSVKGLQVVVDDVQAWRAELMGSGIDVGEVQDLAWGSFVYFHDPDGNSWSVQQLPART